MDNTGDNRTVKNMVVAFITVLHEKGISVNEIAVRLGQAVEDANCDINALAHETMNQILDMRDN